MYYIVGLGNPGKEYACTRHNTGCIVVRWFLEDMQFPQPHESRAQNALVSEGLYDNKEVTAVLPNTYMNDSGSCVAKAVGKTDTENLLIIYDDIDLPLGEIRVSKDRGDGGHNGVKSITASLGTSNYARLRIGIAKKGLFPGAIKRPRGEALVGYVLGIFSKKEFALLEKQREKTRSVIQMFITDGVRKTMDTYNKK